MTFTYKIPCFDLEQTAGSGQVFRMIPAPGRTNTWQVISQGHVCFIRQENDIFFLECGPDLENFWKNYFDLNTDYEKMIASITPDDHYLKAASKAGQGIRILRQDTWEMIITFLISQQNNISRIRSCIERLCVRYGEKLKAGDTEYYSFPTPQQLSGATEEELRRLGMGYRARYIVETTRSILEGEVSLEKLYQMKYYRRARKELMKLSGVGEKVADCICLFALHHMDAFPIDTHIRQVLDEHYRRGFPNRRYHGMRGIMQQYIFYYELIGERGKI